MLVENNDSNNIFSDSKNVLCIVDGDAYDDFQKAYNGETEIICSPVDDLEKYIYQNRTKLLPGKVSALKNPLILKKLQKNIGNGL